MSKDPVNRQQTSLYANADDAPDVEEISAERPTDGQTQAREPTSELYFDLASAYRFFNATLFDGSLPACVITLQRKQGAAGFFSADRFRRRDIDGVFDEIALNPVHFAKQSKKRILSVLVHEMCHLWQHHYGKPARGRYHNREWAGKMVFIGLIPSDTGEPGGRQTGDRVNHYLREGGPFELACDQLLATGSGVAYVEREDARGSIMRERKRASKTAYSCENCDAKVWGKRGTRVRCDNCDVLMIECSAQAR